MKLPTTKEIEAMRDAVLEKDKTASLQDKALMVIDSILSEYEDEADNAVLNKIYRIAHGCSPFTSCVNAHNEWQQETLTDYAKIIDVLKEGK